MRRGLAPVAAGLAWLVCSLAGADDSLDDLIDDFDDDLPRHASTVTPETDPARPISESVWDMSGDVYLASSLAYAHDAPNAGEADYRGLSKLRIGGKLGLDLDLGRVDARVQARGFRDLVFPIKKRDEFTHRVLSAYEADFELGEAWVRASPMPGLDIQVGRQIVAWGRSETLRVVDVLNPIDNREPGVVDLADLRLPVAMTRVDFFRGQIGITGIAIHEQRSNKEPEPGSEFFPAGIPLPGFDRPANGGGDTEWGVALSGRFQGWDASLHWARFYEDRPRLDPDTGLLTPSRISLFGVTGNYALGNWLLKGEAARNQGLRYFGVPHGSFARSDGLLGVEYAGFHDTSIALEVVGRHIHAFDPVLERVPDVAEENTLETALRYSASFRNDTLRVTLLAVMFGEWGRDGAAYRASVTRELRSGLIAEFGVAVYEGGDVALFEAFDENDRVFFSLKQSF